MKVTEKLLTRLEGEVRLKLIWKDGKIEDAFVTVPYFRGFEKVMVGRPALDALVITPRVCGICNHAHLMAAVKAIEDLYRNNSLELSISRKADTLRKVTLFAEMIQNHIRWFYLYLMPDLIRLDRSLKEDFEPLKGKSWRKGLEISNKAVKVIALFGGQWPHTSYALPGGVACDPTNYEVGKAVALLREILDFFRETLLGMDPEEYVLQMSTLVQGVDSGGRTADTAPAVEPVVARPAARSAGLSRPAVDAVASVSRTVRVHINCPHCNSRLRVSIEHDPE